MCPLILHLLVVEFELRSGQLTFETYFYPSLRSAQYGLCRYTPYKVEPFTRPPMPLSFWGR